jgi:hypothetical protein
MPVNETDLLTALIERGGWLAHLIKTADEELANVKTQIRDLCPNIGTEITATDFVMRVQPNRRWSPEKARSVIHPDLLPLVSEVTPIRTKCELVLKEEDLKKCFNEFPNIIRIQEKNGKAE